MNRILDCYILFVITSLFIFGILSQNELLMLCNLFILWGYMFFFCIKDVNRHITLWIYLVSFFTFLMGRILLPVFNLEDLINNIGGANFGEKTKYHIYISLYIALLFVFIGYKQIVKTGKHLEKYEYASLKISVIRKLTKKIVYIFFTFAILNACERILFVNLNGYYAYYTSFETRLPYFVFLLGELFEYSVYLYLATMPVKKEAMPILILYLVNGVSYMGIGQRGGFVLSLLFVITYFFLRNKIEPGESKWIGKRGIIISLLSLPVLASFLYLFAYMRTDRDIGYSNNLFLGFLYQQGVSVEVIGYGYEYENSLPEGRLYSIGDIVNYVNHNKIAQVFFGKRPIDPQSVEHAMDDHSFDAALTYIVKPHFYLAGGGLGSSYIAEAWEDMGYIGIILFSCMYGCLLALIFRWCHTSYWWTVIGFIMYNNIIYAPRARAIKFIFDFFSVAVLLLLLFVFIYSVCKIRKNKYIVYEESNVVIQ